MIDSCANKIYSPNVLLHDTEISKASKKDNSHYYYPMNFNHATLPKPEKEGCRNIRKINYFKFPRHNHQGLMLRKVILELNQRKSWIT
jgi:hypothetical protein